MGQALEKIEGLIKSLQNNELVEAIREIVETRGISLTE